MNTTFLWRMNLTAFVQKQNTSTHICTPKNTFTHSHFHIQWLTQTVCWGIPMNSHLQTQTELSSNRQEILKVLSEISNSFSSSFSLCTVCVCARMSYTRLSALLFEVMVIIGVQVCHAAIWLFDWLLMETCLNIQSVSLMFPITTSNPLETLPIMCLWITNTSVPKQRQDD